MTSSSPAPERVAPVIIGGVEREMPEERTLAVHDPAHRDHIVGRATLATPAEVDEAVRSARGAFPEWRSLSAAERAAAMLAAADATEPGIEERARLLTREHGKLLTESRHDVGGAASILRYYAGLAERYDQPEVTEDHRGRIVTKREPFGVVAVIVPWNAPVYLGFLMIAPALLAGNTVVVKPSEEVPLALVDTLRLITSALPQGVLNVVPGRGEPTGQALAGHPGVARISFTGSVRTGAALMRAAAEGIRSLSLELGGNDPAVVLEGADVDDALVSELVRGVYTGAGQICYNVKRIYVHRSHHDDFVERFTDATAELVVGDGLDPASTMGPLTTGAQYDFVSQLLERTRRSGATVRTVGRKLRPDEWDEGWFLLPSVVTDVEPGSELVTCEQFGPVVPILSFDDEDEAVRLANASDYGLAASVWDSDVGHAFEVAESIEAGTVFTNIHRIGASDVSMPFGGFKRSGFGRGHGYIAVEESSQVKVMAQRVDLSTYPAPTGTDEATGT